MSVTPSDPAIAERMPRAHKVLIAIFNCFGDSFIGAKVAQEFIEKWNSEDRVFLVVTHPHLEPHIRTICKNAEVVTLRRKNPFDWIRLAYKIFLTHRGFDIGVNPNSFSKESCRIIRWASWSQQWKTWSLQYYGRRGSDNPTIPNYYEKLRSYFGLPVRGEFRSRPAFNGDPKNILVCPDSGEARRSLTCRQLEQLIGTLKERWGAATISVATSQTDRADGLPVVLLGKTKVASRRYLNAIIAADLIVTVDSGTLHLADALGKPMICLFSSSMPATVLNSSANAFAARSERLKEIYCEVKNCQKPRCLDEVVIDFDRHMAVNGPIRRIEAASCPWADQKP